MTNKTPSSADRALKMTTQIVASYVQGNTVSASDIPEIMTSVHQSVLQLCAIDGVQQRHRKPSVPVDQSITPDHIICLEDGKRFKMLKKHLKTKYDLTPEEYRAKWDLPADYPMVAPNYTLRRQALAKASGLGRSR